MIYNPVKDFHKFKFTHLKKKERKRNTLPGPESLFKSSQPFECEALVRSALWALVSYLTKGGHTRKRQCPQCWVGVLGHEATVHGSVDRGCRQGGHGATKGPTDWGRRELGLQCVVPFFGRTDVFLALLSRLETTQESLTAVQWARGPKPFL